MMNETDRTEITEEMYYALFKLIEDYAVRELEGEALK